MRKLMGTNVWTDIAIEYKKYVAFSSTLNFGCTTGIDPSEEYIDFSRKEIHKS